MAQLKLDEITLAVLRELTAEVNAEFGKKLSVEDVRIIVETQFLAIPIAIQRGQGIKLPSLGKLSVAKGKSKDLLNEDLLTIQHKYATCGGNPLTYDFAHGY